VRPASPLAGRAQLRHALPDLLITLYKLRNGGSIAGLCIPLAGHKAPTLCGEVLMPFGRYNELIRAETLRTVWDAVCGHADPNAPDEADQFPHGSKAQLMLAQWYRETLFLDYNQPGAPRVGFADFDRFDAEANRDWVTLWEDFETFFVALRHYEPV